MKNIDPLTGVLNRRLLYELGDSAHDFLVMTDLDFFKEINDQYGHTFGDQLLVQFAEVARQNLRQNDLVIRYGGDEFVFILGDLANTESCYKEVERILERIQIQFKAMHNHLPLEFSFGIASLEGGLEAAIETADRRMYVMKEEKKGSHTAAPVFEPQSKNPNL